MEITSVQELRKSCFKREKIITAGKVNYTFTINHRQQQASAWEKELISV